MLTPLRHKEPHAVVAVAFEPPAHVSEPDIDGFLGLVRTIARLFELPDVRRFVFTEDSPGRLVVPVKPPSVEGVPSVPFGALAQSEFVRSKITNWSVLTS